MDNKRVKPGERLKDKFKTEAKQAQIAPVGTVNAGSTSLNKCLSAFGNKPDVEKHDGEGESVEP